MTDKKLTKGTYYSCSHQQLSKNKCDCHKETERERERDQEYSKKRKRFLELIEKIKNRSITVAEKTELRELTSWNSPLWNQDKSYHEKWEWETGEPFPKIEYTLTNEPDFKNFTSLPCQECGISGREWVIAEIKGCQNSRDKREEYVINKDCYINVKGNNTPTFTCVNHKEKKSPDKKEQAVVSAILAYFQKHSIKSIKLENNKLIIKFSNKTEKQEEVNNAELQQIQSYIQNHSQNNELTLEELEQIKSNTEKPFNWTPWIIGGSIVIGLILLAIIISSRKRKKA